MGLGIDFGKVIMGAIQGGQADTSFLGGSLAAAMETPPGDQAFPCIAQLVDQFSGKVWIVSKCGPSVERKTRAWLEHWDFYKATGLHPEHLRFCRERHEKAGICKELGIQHFVDDRLDVLAPMRGLVQGLYLFGEQSETAPDWVTAVPNWPATLDAIQRARL